MAAKPHQLTSTFVGLRFGGLAAWLDKSSVVIGQLHFVATAFVITSSTNDKM